MLLALPYLSFCQVEDKCDETPQLEKSELSFYDKILDYSFLKIGIRYGRNGFDCSGLVAKAFKTVGVELPHSSKLQSKLGEKINKNEAKPGDLIFFSSPKSKKSVGHVGIITQVTESGIQFVHAAVKGGIKLDYLNSKYYLKHFIMIKRNLFQNQINEVSSNNGGQ